MAQGVPLHARNADTALAVGSAFKLGVLRRCASRSKPAHTGGTRWRN